MKKIFIYGASGHGLVVADVATACGYKDIIFIDDGQNDYLNFEAVKSNCDIPIALGVGINSVRQCLYEKAVSCGFEVVSLIHPTAVVSENSSIGKGTVIMPNVVVNAKSLVGDGVILNTSSIVEHENCIGDYAHISPGVALAGNVNVNECAHIGIGSCVIQGVTVGKHSTIGAGSVVVKNIEDNCLAFGNPCIKIRNFDE